MSKITFRADDDLVDRLEAFDASKSEVMRRALRAYLDEEAPESSAASASASDTGGIDEVIADRIDELVAERLDARLPARSAREERDINVNITLDGTRAAKTPFTPEPETDENRGETGDTPTESESDTRETDVDDSKTSSPDTGSTSDTEGERPQTPRKTCGQCGENIESGDVYCPNCGEKATHRVFCECGDELRSDWAFCPSCGRRTPAADVLDRP